MTVVSSKSSPSSLGRRYLRAQSDLGSMLRLTRDSAGLDRLLTDDEARRAADEARRAAEARICELEAELARRRNDDASS